MELTSLAIDPKKLEEKRKAMAVPCEEGAMPKYPYGTAMYLENEVLEALGITEMPAAGTVVRIMAVARVTGSSEREFEGPGGAEKRKTLDVQITDMAMAPAAKKGQSFGDAAGSLYGKPKAA